MQQLVPTIAILALPPTLVPALTRANNLSRRARESPCPLRQGALGASSILALLEIQRRRKRCRDDTQASGLVHLCTNSINGSAQVPLHGSDAVMSMSV